MKNTEKPKFLEAFMTLCEMWEKEPTKRMIDMWWAIFKNHSLADFQKGIARATATLKNYGRLPMPSDIAGLMTDDQVLIEDQALIVANKILCHVNTKGHRVFPDIHHDPTAVYLMTYRWPYYNWAKKLLDRDVTWWIKEFCDLYRATSKDTPKMLENHKVKLIVDSIGQDINENTQKGGTET